MSAKFIVSKPILWTCLIFNLGLAEIQLIDENFVGPISSSQGWFIPVGSKWNSICGSTQILGGQNGFNYTTLINKFYDELPPHYQIKINFDLWRIDTWNINNEFTVYVDNQLVYKYIYLSMDSSSDICGDASPDSIISIEFVVDHFSISSYLAMTTINGGWWGISKFKLSVIKCPFNCKSCNQYQCFNNYVFLELFRKKIFNIDNQDGWYDNNNLPSQSDTKCDFNILSSSSGHLAKSFILEDHFAINLYLKVAILYTITSKVDVEIDGKVVYTSPSLSSQVTTFRNYICSTQLILHQINIHQIQHTNRELTVKVTVDLSHHQQNNRLFGIRDFQLFIKSDLNLDTCQDSNISPFDGCFNQQFSCCEGCSNCIKGICIQCQDEWEYIPSIEQCVPICGNQKIQQDEQCDDGNSIPYDGCYLCKFQCPQDCQNCYFGQCLDCQIFYQLSFNKQQCIPQCNDGITILDEICDDKNNIQFDGCYKCQLNCDLNCLTCLDQKCLLCEQGWQLRDYKCYQECGDGQFAINSIEQCDDGNSIVNDGCYNCQIECIPNCSLCLNNQICLSCQNNFYLEGESCLPICGDGIIVIGLEECEDGNNEPYDGCYKCQYQCQFGCLDCFNQKYTCKECDAKYTLNVTTGTCQEIQKKYDENKEQNIDEINNPINHPIDIRCNQNFVIVDYQCVNQCGNGILDGVYELCDDGNLVGGDGCSVVCTEEENYFCQNHINRTSICSYIQYPDFQLQSLSSKTNQTQIIELTFTQQVNLIANMNFDDFALITIFPKNNAAIYIQPEVNLSTTLGYPIYQILIEFPEPVEDPLLQIDFAKSIIKNEYGLDLVKNSQQINLGTPFVLSDNNQKQIIQIVLLNDAMIYSMISISGLSMLTGNAIMFFNLLDLLQSLSYIKYMQYSFPPHLMQFLNIYNKVSLKPLLDYLKIDELLSYANGGILPLRNSNQKAQSQIQINQLNELYLFNAKSCFFSIFGSILTFVICKIFTSNKIQSYQQVLFRKFQNNRKYLLIDSFFLHKVQKFALKFKNEYFSFGITKIYLAILHQFLFSALLQFPNYSFISPFMIFNSIIAIFGLGFNLFISLQLLSITSSDYKDQQKWKYFHQDFKTEFWASNFRSFQIYRIMFYIFIIVEALNYPEIQSILLSMSSLFYLIYILKFTPLQSKYEFGKLISREILFILITGSFLIYSFQMSQNQYLYFGWIHIGLFSLMLISNLIIDLVESIDKAWKSYKKKQERRKLKEIKRNQENSPQQLITEENQKQAQIKH